MRDKNKIVRAILLLTLISFTIARSICVQAANKTISATISSEYLKVSQTLAIVSEEEGLSFESKDIAIAYVNDKGVIFGKKAGKVVIAVTKKGFTTEEFEISVMANGRKPNILVSYEEVELVQAELDGNGNYSVIIKNNSVADVKNVKCVYQVDVKTETGIETTMVSLESGIIAPGELSQRLTCQGPASLNMEDMKPLTVAVYSGKALLTYHSEEDRVSYTWGVPDTTAPVISGLVGKNSYKKSNAFRVVYSDKKTDYTKYVMAMDDRDKEVILSVDTSKVDFEKDGNYTITYTATDKAGNTATKDATIQVRVPKQIDNWADEVLKEIVKKSWSDEKKARAIYIYMRKTLSYVDHSDKSSWEKSAEAGLKYRNGDCFTYFACSRLLLTRAGIPNLMVKKYGGSGRHWWNLVYIDGGWYHFDTTPRQKSAIFCLLTDKQLKEYSDHSGNSHRWDKKEYPKTAKIETSELILNKKY